MYIPKKLHCIVSTKHKKLLSYNITLLISGVDTEAGTTELFYVVTSDFLIDTVAMVSIYKYICIIV
jgi:hypothetical protein